MSTDTFLSLMKTLIDAGWKVIKYEDLDGGVTLTIAPEQEKKEKKT